MLSSLTTSDEYEEPHELDTPNTLGLQLAIRKELELFVQSSLRRELGNLGTQIKKDVQFLLEMKLKPNSDSVRSTETNAASSSQGSRPRTARSQSVWELRSNRESKSQTGKTGLEPEIGEHRRGTSGNALHKLKQQNSAILDPSAAIRNRALNIGPRNYRSFQGAEAIENVEVKAEIKNRRLSIRAPPNPRLLAVMSGIQHHRASKLASIGDFESSAIHQNRASRLASMANAESSSTANHNRASKFAPIEDTDSSAVPLRIEETSVVPMCNAADTPLAVRQTMNGEGPATESNQKMADRHSTSQSVRWASPALDQSLQWASPRPKAMESVSPPPLIDESELVDGDFEGVNSTPSSHRNAPGTSSIPLKLTSVASFSKVRKSLIPNMIRESVRTLVAQLPTLQKAVTFNLTRRSTEESDVGVGPQVLAVPSNPNAPAKRATGRATSRSTLRSVRKGGTFIGGTAGFGKEMRRNKHEDLPLSWTWRVAERLVNHIGFDIFTGALVFFNSIWIGIYTDMLAQNIEDKDSPSTAARGIDITFAAFFGLELALRIFVYRCAFFTSKDREWNLFDALLVALQVFEEVMFSFQSLSFMRVLRILRLVRVLRLVRIVRLISELRTIISSVVSTWKSLGWTMVLLTLIIYTVGIFFSQLVLDHATGSTELEDKFGTVGNSILSLFGAITGGVDWTTLAEPLITDIHPICGLIFSLYIAFCVLAMLNIVTGVFVDSALMTAKRDKDVDLVNTLREVFLKTDEENAGVIELAEFEAHISDSQMDAVFKAVDLDKTEARGLFELIDVENKGSISRDDFIMGCLRLKGPAKALDLATLMFDMKRMANMLEELFEMTEHIDEMTEHIDEHIEHIDEHIEHIDEHVEHMDEHIVEGKKA